MNEHLDGIYLCCQNVHALVDVRTHHLYIYIHRYVHIWSTYVMQEDESDLCGLDFT